MANEKTLHVPPRPPAAIPATPAEVLAGVEIRMRCLEAAAQPALVAPHKDGYAAGILAAAQEFEAWVLKK